MNSTLLFDVVLTWLLVFVAVQVLARILALFESYVEGRTGRLGAGGGRAGSWRGLSAGLQGI